MNAAGGKKRPVESYDHRDKNPPHDAKALASWFSEAVYAEIAELEKQSTTQSHEVLSGTLVESKGPTSAVYRFLLADGTRLPEEATGRLKTTTDEYGATVVGQQADRIHILLKGEASLPARISRGLLVVDDTALLRKLAEVLDGIAANEKPTSSLATTIFHPADAEVGSTKLCNTPAYSPLEEHQRRAVEQACGSSLTFVWGPPGTGKTYVIARLLAALIEAGERVLVASHTNAAVDQALYESIKTDRNSSGPLANSPAIRDGKILRIGQTTEAKIPDAVRLDKVLEVKARSLTDEIERLEGHVKPLRSRRSELQAAIAEWDKLRALRKQLSDGEQAMADAREALQVTDAEVVAVEAAREQCDQALEAAHRAWFWRATRVGRATRAVETAARRLFQTQQDREAMRAAQDSASRTMHEAKKLHLQQEQHCAKLIARDKAEQTIEETNEQIAEIEERLRELHDQLAQLEKEIISEAQAIFCTLTKNYSGDALREQMFDAVIVDEISMALPPLLYLAANRASRRVVLVGDFLQLPPIVRSDTPVSNERLGKDIFEMAGIASDGKVQPGPGSRVLAPLVMQHRMVPGIADVARRLVYERAEAALTDHPKVVNRIPPRWMSHLPSTPLLIVDTADLHCWSGKQPGSLSRFNLYSSILAVEIAASAARNLESPPRDHRRPIGIITPFAAQRRLLRRLVDDMDLAHWIAAGTVHTFQGQEAELIIFDSVLDEPYWSARLCTPARRAEVLRDLNVAITRTRDMFIFIGSSEWLNKHAKLPSGLGALWDYLKGHADLVSASEIVDRELFQDADTLFADCVGWSPPGSGEGVALQALDEHSFFDAFAQDIRNAKRSIFALVAYFGQYRWPRIEPLFRSALNRGVEVTIITPPAKEAPNPSYVDEAIKNLRRIGAVVTIATGMHGKKVIIDEKIIYTGSMNFASHRGRVEDIDRIVAPGYAKLCLEMLQAKHIRQAAFNADGSPRTCPHGHPVQVVNLRRQPRWDHNPLKIGCADDECRYLVAIDQRAPFIDRPRCQVDQRTKYRRVRRGRGERWECPKHPKKCDTYKVVPGDTE